MHQEVRQASCGKEDWQNLEACLLPSSLKAKETQRNSAQVCQEGHCKQQRLERWSRLGGPSKASKKNLASKPLFLRPQKPQERHSKTTRRFVKGVSARWDR